jgi:dihydrofolate synthase / folylpolyglutamate synthase
VTYSEAIQFLYDLRLFGAKFGLENTRRLAALAGHPEEKLRFIHVAGTNGKGSTCAMLESIYRAAGLRVGLYTSPHLVSFCERFQVNREPVSESAVVRLVERLRPLLNQFPRDQHPTFFEVVTVMALLYFAERECDLVVWETGMGGRLDATNIITPLASVITNVTADHQRWLGNTIEQIAAEKAGIIKPSVPVITGAIGKALEVIERTARLQHAKLIVVAPDDNPAFPLPLAGEFQKSNAAIVLATVDALRPQLPVSDDAVREGLANVHWPGRMQEVRTPFGTRILLDGAHNLAGVEALARELRTRFADSRPTLIFGVLEDKDWHAMIDLLEPLVSRVIFVPVQSVRSVNPEELVALSRKAGLSVSHAPTLGDALQIAKADPSIVITGSLYLVGEALELLRLDGQAPRGERFLNEWVAPP